MADANEKLGIAKSKLMMFHPFFATIVCNLPLERDDTIPTMGTNGKWIKYNEEFVNKLTVEELLFVLCHEVGHVIFQHMFRRKHRDPLKWNVAGDYVINDMLVGDGIGRMPAMGLLDQDLVRRAGGSTDAVYDLLPDDCSDKGNGGNGTALDECMDTGGDAAQQAQAEAEAKVLIAQATQVAKAAGKLGDKLARLVDMSLTPVIPWQDVLRRFVSQRAKVEYTFARPKRRFMSDDLYLPSLNGNSMGDIAVYVDCSGSVSMQELSEFAAEMRAIKEDCLPYRMHVIYFHHEVAHYDVFAQDEELRIQPHGTGGTDFAPMFKYTLDNDINPVCGVVLTDLECHSFGPPPEFPVLWVSNSRDTAPWGEIVMMKKGRG